MQHNFPPLSEDPRHTDKGRVFQNCLRHAHGHVAEVGVFKGHLFRHMVAQVLGQEVTANNVPVAHAYDSFEGVATPGKGDNAYYEGEFDVGGLEGFHREMLSQGISPEEYVCHKGWVPNCLSAREEGLMPMLFNFIHLDLDHYEPTRLAAHWAWAHLSPHGVLACHDYNGTAANASGGIQHFLRELPGWHNVAVENTEILIRKGG